MIKREEEIKSEFEKDSDKPQDDDPWQEFRSQANYFRALDKEESKTEDTPMEEVK